MASWQARLGVPLVRWRVRSALGDMRDIARVRRAFGQAPPGPGGVRYEPGTLGGVPGEWVLPQRDPEPTTALLYLHGGGFVGCSPRTHRGVTAALARLGLRVYVPDYRLAPEHPFPAAPDDALAVWRALRALRAPHGPQRLVVAGDSAGGNLALTLMLALRDAGEPLPDAAALFSPALDLTGGSASLHLNAERDAMFHGPSLEHLAAAYLAGADPNDPRASPLLADLSGLPPLLVHVGESECLRDDSLRLADKARAAGVCVQLQVWPVVSHVWQLAGLLLPEARRSVRAAAHFLQTATRDATIETHDVVIVGAGLSGIGAAVHLQRRCPAHSYALLEARTSIGGTWDLFRYPGVRSDSDMFTLGYGFKPWQGTRSMADGAAIKAYIEETAAEHGITPQIRFGHRVQGAQWSSADALWTLDVEVQREGEAPSRQRIRCRMLLGCVGYYRYDQGHRPPLPGQAQYRGRWVHPQHWPEGLDVAGRQVLVIGSGATAMTLVPALAERAAHVTMLQRSPTYVVALPARDRLARALHWLPSNAAARIVKLKNVLLAATFFQLARRWPEKVKARVVGQAARLLGPARDQIVHFTPTYKPWDQRVCFVPDADLFRAIRKGRASVVTDHIDTFTEQGVRLRSGREIGADIVVTATGLELQALGGIQVTVDGQARDLSQTMAYKGVMLSDLPNLVFTFGYTNASWTLKADLTARWTCRLLQHMARHGHRVAVPRRDPAVAGRPFLDLSAGYVQRSAHRLPQQGSQAPWTVSQNYLKDLFTLGLAPIDDGTLRFEDGDRR